MNAQTKFIVWDWNGTLQDDLCVSHKCMNIILERMGKDLVDEDKYRDSFEIPIINLYRSVGFTDHDVEHHMDEAQEIFYSSYAEHISSVGFRDGAIEILDYGQRNGIANVVLSNHQQGQVVADLQRLGKHDSFLEILAYTDRSPHRETRKGSFLPAFMEKNALRPENGLIIGDTAEETHIGREYGLVTVAITGGYSSEQRLHDAKPDYLIHSLRELLPILEQRRAA